MKNLRQFCAAVVLALLLVLPAFAGEMGFPVVPPPPSAPASATTQGETDSPVVTPEAEMVVVSALGVLQSLLSIF